MALLGPSLILVFCFSQAFRDVYFGHVFQDVDFFAVILLAFLLSTVLFAAITTLRTPGAFETLRGFLPTVLAINVTTAGAWSCYFFGLTHLEPAIVNTLHSGMAPLTVVALAALGVRIVKTETPGWGEYLSYAGIALSLIGLWWVVLSDSAGLAGASVGTNVASLVLLLASGALITISLLYCKRLHDHGVSAEAVTTVRYALLILLALVVVLSKGRLVGIETFGQLATLSVLATLLIVLPLFALQVGIARTAPLAAHVLRSLGPVCVFAVQQIDGRMSYSGPTLVCILIYSACAIAANLAHGWSGQPTAGHVMPAGTRGG